MVSYPTKYPIDHGLLLDAEKHSRGSNVHEITKCRTWYQNYATTYNYLRGFDATAEERETYQRTFHKVVQWERRLRGVVAEAQANRLEILFA